MIAPPAAGNNPFPIYDIAPAQNAKQPANNDVGAPKINLELSKHATPPNRLMVVNA